MMTRLVAVILSGVFFVGLGFAEDFSVADHEAAFEKMTVKIMQTSLSGKEVKELGFVDEDDKTDIDYDGFVYTLDFRNRSSIDLNDLKVECRFFYTVESQWRARASGYDARTRERDAEEKSEQKYYEDSLEVNLRSGERYKAETRAFIIKSWALTSGYYFSSGTADKANADPIGLWVRISFKTPSGDTVTRDFCEPKSIFSQISWEGESI